MPLLANKSEVNLDTSWSYFFANLSTVGKEPMEFTVFLKEGTTELSLKWMFSFNIHEDFKLTPSSPTGTTGSTKSTLNSTWITFIGVSPESTSNVSFQVKGGYEDENVTFIITPNQWFTHTVILRARDANETRTFPHTEIILTLENPNGTAKLTLWHYKIAWDPDVDQNLDTAGIEMPLTIALIIGSLFLLVVLRDNKRKIQRWR